MNSGGRQLIGRKTESSPTIDSSQNSEPTMESSSPVYIGSSTVMSSTIVGLANVHSCFCLVFELVMVLAVASCDNRMTIRVITANHLETYTKQKRKQKIKKDRKNLQLLTSFRRKFTQFLDFSCVSQTGSGLSRVRYAFDVSILEPSCRYKSPGRKSSSRDPLRTKDNARMDHRYVRVLREYIPVALPQEVGQPEFTQLNNLIYS